MAQVKSPCDVRIVDSSDVLRILRLVEVKMADRSELVAAMVEALKDHSVVDTLLQEIREEIRKGFQDELSTMQKGLEERDRKIDELSQRVEELEQYGRRNGVRIHGIKEEKGENTDKIVTDLAQSIGADITKHALGRSHRVGPEGGTTPRPIIAKFVGHNHKVELMKHKKNLRELGPKGADGKPLNPIYINEDLTKTRVKWAQRARALKKAGKVSDTWTRDGIIFLKIKDSDTVTVTSDKDKEKEKEKFHIERIDSEEKLSEVEKRFELKLTIPKSVF